MKKVRNLINLALCTLIMTGCNKSSSPSTSQTSAVNDTDWTDETKKLLETYCGEVLPFPTDMIKGHITAKVVPDEASGIKYLEIRDESDEFTLENYYESLENSNWNTIVSYSNKKIRTSNDNIEYVELTKNSSDNKIGYDINYFFMTEKGSDGEITSSYNCIQCYNTFQTTTTSDTSWSNNDMETIKSVITIDLPYFKSSRTEVYGRSDYMQIYDYYTKDLTKEYANILIEQAGFELAKVYSTAYDCYYLIKTFDDGSKIKAILEYIRGNLFEFQYVPKYNFTSSWPTELVDEIKEKSGFEIPKFEIAENGYYISYKKNDTYYIYTYTRSDSYDYEAYANLELKPTKVLWDEKIYFLTIDLLDNEDDANKIGYEIVATLTTPTSTFCDSWPTSKINEVVSSLLNINGVDLPTLDASSIPDTGKQLKYVIYGEDYYKEQYDFYYEDISDKPTFYGLSDDASEEEIKTLSESLARQTEGIKISILDDDNQARNAYMDKLYNAGWYFISNTTHYAVYEDPTGKLAVIFDESTYANETPIRISPGSGEKHSPEFYFKTNNEGNKETIPTCEVGIGHEKLLEIEKNMLPYSVTYSSNKDGITVDADGNVSIDKTVAEGTEAIITASVSVPGESSPRTCQIKIKAVEVFTYTISDTIDAVKKLIEAENYTYTANPNPELDSLSINFASSDVNTVKEIVQEKLIPDQFSQSSDDWEETTYTIKEGDDEINAQYIKYSFMSEYNYITLEFYVYTADNGDTMLLIQVY